MTEWHDPATCAKGCTYVGNRAFIHVTKQQQDAAQHTLGRILKAMFGLLNLESLIVPIGRFTLPQWTGCHVWYLFHCVACKEMSVDYLHGHDLYLTCQNDACGTHWHVRGKLFYELAGMPPPPTPAQERKMRKEIMQRIRALPPPRRD